MRRLPKWLKGLIILALSFEMAACGTLMYPQRRGQKEGHLDVVVVLLDGLGLFFFIIPGVIAYVIDFGDGTIYFPARDTRSVGGDLQPSKIVRFDAKHYTPDSLRTMIEKETGCPFDWQDARLRAIRLDGKSEMPIYFARAAAVSHGA